MSPPSSMRALRAARSHAEEITVAYLIEVTRKGAESEGLPT